MRTLVVAGYGVRIRARKGRLVIEKNGERRELSVADVDQIVVATGGVSVTSRAVRLLARSGVDLVFLDARGMPAARLSVLYHTRTVETRRAQYRAYESRLGAAVAKEMCYAKVRNQAEHLKYLASRLGEPELRYRAYDVEDRAARIREVDGGEPSDVRSALMHLEAEAARIYWGCIAAVLPGGLGFQGRDPGSGDPVNSSLSYCYAILYSEAWKALSLAGLDPYAGFLHVDRSGQPVLCYDYADPFKPVAVDKPLVEKLLKGWKPELAAEGLLEASTRGELAAMVYEALSSRVRCRACGRSSEVAGEMRRHAVELARSLREGSPYRCFEARL